MSRVDEILSKQPLLEKVALRLTKDPEDAKDLVQVTLARAIDKAHQFKEGSLNAWLVTVMRSRFINSKRQSYRKKVMVGYGMEEMPELSSSTNETEELIDYLSLVEVVHKKLDTFTPYLRDPFILLLEGYTYKEISEKLDCNMNTIKSRIFLARKILRQYLAPYKKLIFD